MNNIKNILFTAPCIFVILSATAFSELPIVNYDNHPDLEKAMEYDLTMDNMRFLKPDGTIDHELYDSYVAKADRHLAEKYYLKYLEDVNEPFQRARVYYKLGRLFSGGVSPRVTPPDEKNLSKAIKYFEKVLELEPNAISTITLNARGGLTMDPQLSKEEKFYAKMEYYEWLASVDEKKVKENWIPLWPVSPEAYLTENGTKDLLDSFQGHAETMADNLVLRAVNLGRMEAQSRGHTRQSDIDPKYLMILLKKYPESRISRFATKKLKNIMTDHAANEQLKSMWPDEKDNKTKSLSCYKKIFLPNLNSVLKKNKPWLLDIKTFSVIDYNLPNYLNSEEAAEYLQNKDKGNLAWIGKFVPVKNTMIYSVLQEKHPLKQEKYGWFNSYKIPEKCELPYRFLLKIKEGNFFLAKVLETKLEGVTLEYKEITPELAKKYTDIENDN